MFEQCNAPSEDNATNVHALLHLSRSDQTFPAGRHIMHDDFDPHPDCRWTTFRLLNNMSASTVEDASTKGAINCCRDLIVFRDLAALQVVDGSQSAVETDNANNSGDDDDGFDGNPPNRTWYESEVIVTGFKDIHIKGKSIWI